MEISDDDPTSMNDLDFICDRVWAWDDSIGKDVIKQVLEDYISVRAIADEKDYMEELMFLESKGLEMN